MQCTEMDGMGGIGGDLDLPWLDCSCVSLTKSLDFSGPQYLCL